MNKKPYILVSRSSNKNILLTNKLKQLGFQTLTLDLLEYKKLDINFNKYKEYKYCLVTSLYTAEILSKSLSVIYEYYLVVGSKSTNILRACFSNSIVISFKNVYELKKYIQGISSNQIIYFSGTVITSDIPKVKRVIIYDIIYLSYLPISFLEIINKVSISYIMLYSCMAMKKLLLLFEEYNIFDKIKYANIICISKELYLNAIKYFSYVKYSNISSENDMLDIIENCK